MTVYKPKIGDRVIGRSERGSFLGVLIQDHFPHGIKMGSGTTVFIFDGFIHPAPEASTILEKSASHLRDRADQRDKADGERSMQKCISAFNAITGHALSERDGWLFMVMLKSARACVTPSGIADDYEDMAAYAALAGECAAVTRAKETTHD